MEAFPRRKERGGGGGKLQFIFVDDSSMFPFRQIMVTSATSTWAGGSLEIVGRIFSWCIRQNGAGDRIFLGVVGRMEWGIGFFLV